MGTSLTTTAVFALMQLKRVGRCAALGTVRKPLDETDPAGSREAFISHALNVFKPRFSFSKNDLLDAWMKSEDKIHQNLDEGLDVISFHHSAYPKRLKNIPDPPAVLFVKGDSAGLHADKSIAVIGTREPTSYGTAVSEKYARAAAEAGFAVVSGLAHGCDTFAHWGCVKAHGAGVAVLAHGLDKVYPAANRGLAERLIGEGGCLVSEYPVGVMPARQAFADRDRIQSGLSDAVLVIETGVEGGPTHAVRFSGKQGRPLACVAHPDQFLAEEKTQGNQKYIKEKRAVPIADEESLIQFLGGITPAASAEVSETSDYGFGAAQQSLAL